MHILIIGGTGVLSTAVTQEALYKGMQVTMINRGNRINLIPNDVELIKADTSDKNTIAKCLKGRHFDAVIDFICYNDEQTTLSFQFYRKYAEQYLFISSCAVYDTRNQGICDEDAPKVLPMWWYSKAKWASEEHLREMATETGTKYTIIRPSVTYDNTRIPYGIAPLYGYHWTLIERVLHKKPIITWNKGENRTNMMRVEDFAVALVGLVGNPKAYNETFNICGDETPSYKEVLDVISELSGCRVQTMDISPEFYAQQTPNKSGEILGGRALDSINSNAKVKDAVPNFSQSIFIKDGISMTYNAYKEGHYQRGIDWAFDGETDRVVKKWCKSQGIDTSAFHLGFVDYLGDATISQKLTYYQEFYKDNVCMRGLSFLMRVLRKLMNI